MQRSAVIKCKKDTFFIKTSLISVLKRLISAFITLKTHRFPQFSTLSAIHNERKNILF